MQGEARGAPSPTGSPRKGRRKKMDKNKERASCCVPSLRAGAREGQLDLRAWAASHSRTQQTLVRASQEQSNLEVTFLEDFLSRKASVPRWALTCHVRIGIAREKGRGGEEKKKTDIPSDKVREESSAFKTLSLSGFLLFVLFGGQKVQVAAGLTLCGVQCHNEEAEVH